MLFRLRMKPYWKQILATGLLGSFVLLLNTSPLLIIGILCVLLKLVWRYRLVPALLIALSGYIITAILGTCVLVCMEMMKVVSYPEVMNRPVDVILIRIISLLAKCAFFFTLSKFRLGFTFLSNYTSIPFTRENAGVYSFILVVLLGIAYRHVYPNSAYSVIMPIQMLIMATLLFIYATLSKEISFHRR
ncbi:hypothetical protein [Paenibacillus roseipurpureus]|uniref:Uncharacterized protein n=1 Tax=Paenibacillus roseopurpureus TaxID=2918901 RepID=A0AA96LM77_9BACL|nr:hypothetical protein [Paenibacillus sp. MBLB1832]WNR43696.1 hypothetical protein MJB10_21730 [Paenibacillus sp. MBLB1832]